MFTINVKYLFETGPMQWIFGQPCGCWWYESHHWCFHWLKASRCIPRVQIVRIPVSLVGLLFKTRQFWNLCKMFTHFLMQQVIFTTDRVSKKLVLQLSVVISHKITCTDTSHICRKVILLKQSKFEGELKSHCKGDPRFNNNLDILFIFQWAIWPLKAWRCQWATVRFHHLCAHSKRRRRWLAVSRGFVVGLYAR